MLNNTRYNRYKNENKQHKNKKLNKHQHKQKKYLFITSYYYIMNTIHTELKKAIFNYMIENRDLFQLVNSTISHFREYIYNSEGNYLIGWKEVAEFITELSKLI